MKHFVDIIVHLIGGAAYSLFLIAAILIFASLTGRDVRAPSFYGPATHYYAAALIGIGCIIGGYIFSVTEMTSIGGGLICIAAILGVIKYRLSRRRSPD